MSVALVDLPALPRAATVVYRAHPGAVAGVGAGQMTTATGRGARAGNHPEYTEDPAG
ncbi:hypothetical protein [Nocardia bovistercoris]|uniref:Uncharacterized protein n=1 Tax=Nocardia bovistercoris TaxID=2785916 RepID=A0A931N454_9NOCA|nr:hypothetical protein [Nocardia bovistercoris]MBH0777263.1 hypothetical protein [Nocardia bovistercoris]